MRPKSLEEYLAQLSSGEFTPDAADELPPIPLRPDYVPEPIITKPSAPRDPAEIQAPAVPAIAPDAPSDVVKAAIASRYGFGEGMDTEALKAAQEAAQKRTGMSNLMQAGADIGHAIARLPGKADTSYWDKYAEQGKQGVTNIAQLRQATVQDQELGRTQKKYALEDEHNDPNSPKAAIYRNTLAPLARKVGMDPATLKGLSFNELKDVDDIINRQASLKSSEDLRYATIGAAREGRSAAREAREHEKAKLPEKQVDVVTGFDQTLSDMESVMSNLNDKYVGRVRGRWPDISVTDPDEAALRSELGRIEDTYRHAVTGAGAGAAELARLKSRLPSVTDAPDIFRSKAKNFLDEVKRRKQIFLDNQAKGGKRVDSYRTNDSDSQDGLSDAQQKRLEELRRKKAEGTLK